MKKVMAVLTMVALAACGSGTTSGPSGVEQPAQAAAPVAAPAVPVAVSSPTLEVQWSPNASWAITNNGDGTVFYTAQWTDFDNQALVRGSQDGDVKAGTTSRGSFDRGCAQVDLVPLGGGKIFAFAFFGKDGRTFDPGTHPERIAECRPKPTPTPTPTPFPTPTPCADVVAHTAALRLTADKDDPNHGTSFFNYYIKKDVPGNNDPVIWSGRLAKGEKSPLVPVPNDHVGYYGQYDSENYSKTNVVYADCPKGLQAAWRPGLELVCTEQHTCPVE